MSLYKDFNSPHGDLLATPIGVEVRHACLFVKHSLASCTSSEAHTGLDVAGQVGQIHSDSSSTTLQPMLWGALQGKISQASVKNMTRVWNMGLNGNVVDPNKRGQGLRFEVIYQKFW